MAAPTYNATDGVDFSGQLPANTSFSFLHSTSGSDKYLVVVIKVYGDPGTIAVTYNSVSMTQLGTVTEVNVTVYHHVLFGLINPAAGSNTVAIITSNSVGLEAVALTYNGVDQTTPTGTFASADGNSSSPSLVVSSATGELVIDSVEGYATYSMTPDGSQTQRYNNDAVDSLDGSEKVGASSVTMQWTYAVSFGWTMVGISLKPVSGGGGGGGGTIYPQLERKTRGLARGIFQPN